MDGDGEAAARDATLVMDLRREISCSNVEDDFLGKYEGKLREVESDEVAGTVRLFIADLDGADGAGIPGHWLLDFEAATAPYIGLLDTDEPGSFSRAVTSLLGGEDMVYSNNMLIIDRIELLPKFRGSGFGLKCMETCLRHFRLGCRIAAIKPYPLQFECGAKESEDWNSGVCLSTLGSNKRASTQRLRRHYAQLGFRHVRGTDLMIRDLYE